MERRTIVCYLGRIWRRLEQLEQISGRFPSVDQSSRFAGVPKLGKPLYREKTVYIKTHKTAINRPVDQGNYIYAFQGKIRVENHAVLTLLTFLFRLHTRLNMAEPCSSSSKPPR